MQPPSVLDRIKRLIAPRRASLRRPRYDALYERTLRDWLVYHQREIVFDQCYWRGVRTMKNPLDLWIYQEILQEVKPEIVLEIGSYFGGSTQFFADLLGLINDGQVISLDIERRHFQASSPRIIEVTGDSRDRAVVDEVSRLCTGKRTLLVHDADHTKGAVLEDLENYASLVAVGSYLIVEDGLVDLFPRGELRGWDRDEAGPLSAVEVFLDRHREFEIAEDKERYWLTYNPRGYLRRVR